MVVKKKSIPIVSKVTCPHCWSQFPPEDSLWISQHPSLEGQDPRLGETEFLRFSPDRFDLQCGAYDPLGYTSNDVACPKCHLAIARPLIEIPPFFLSIIGAPRSGKSYFLAAMTWRLRQVLPQNFMIGFADADAGANRELQRNENLQFLNMEQDKPVIIEKTQEEADHLYDQVLMGGEAVRYIKPFLFSLRPLPSHPNSNVRSISRVVCLYDNAGESFLPGADAATQPVTRHLGLSKALFFLFDPTQDLRFRRAVAGKTDDFQMTEREKSTENEANVRQDTILGKAAETIRKQMGLSQNEMHESPLIVIVSKFDTWSTLIGENRIEDPWVANPKDGPDGVLVERVHEISARIREVLVKHASELVSVAEGFCREVIYVPVSATGCSPQYDAEAERQRGIAPKDINPMWVEVPLLYTLARFTEGVVPEIRKRAETVSPAEDEERPQTSEEDVPVAENRPPSRPPNLGPPDPPELPDIL